MCSVAAVSRPRCARKRCCSVPQGAHSHPLTLAARTFPCFPTGNIGLDPLARRPAVQSCLGLSSPTGCTTNQPRGPSPRADGLVRLDEHEELVVGRGWERRWYSKPARTNGPAPFALARLQRCCVRGSIGGAGTRHYRTLTGLQLRSSQGDASIHRLRRVPVIGWRDHAAGRG